MAMIPFKFSGPVDTDKELARYRDSLLSFMGQVIPKNELQDALITLNALTVKRFMLQARQHEATVRELKMGVHPQLDAVMEEHVQLRALVQGLLMVEAGPATAAAIAALREHMDFTAPGNGNARGKAGDKE